MPHTNRARRADHYRSIDGAGSSSNTNNTHGGGRKRPHQEQDGGALNHNHDTNPKSSERYGGRSPGASGGGGDRGAGRGRGGARSGGGGTGRGGGGGRGGAAEEAGSGGSGRIAGAATAAGRGKGKGKNPSAKNRIRSLTRLMNKPGIEEEQRLHLQRQVDELEGKVSEREKQERERTLAVKYHKAKFFDRRKALRRLAQIHRKLKGDIGEAARAELERKRDSEEADLKYVLYFPKDKKYLPLGKGKEGPPRAQRSHARFLKEALVRGEATGWTEFQDNLDKFVTGGGEGGQPKVAVDAAATADEGDVKQNQGIGALPVVAQQKLWDDGEDNSSAEGEGTGKSDAEESESDSGDGVAGRQGAGKNAAPAARGKKVKRQPAESGSGRAESEQGEAAGDSSDSAGELSGDEGFGAAASDEDNAYSFAEARMRWASGGATAAAAADPFGSTPGGDSGSASGRSGGSDTDGHESDTDGHDSNGSVGDIYADTLAISNGGGGGSKAGQSDRQRGGSDSDGDSGSDGDVDGSSDGGDTANEKLALGGKRKSQPTAAPPSDPNGSEDEDSGDDIDLKDDFFMEEKGSGDEEPANQTGENT
ncbi:unnamed protein product, partial [Ectocarpus sp. 13 AM-2016]